MHFDDLRENVKVGFDDLGVGMEGEWLRPPTLHPANCFVYKY